MTTQILNPRELPEQAEPPARPRARRQPVPQEAAPTLVDLEEVLVADPRGCLSPSQQVEQKLLALLQTGQPKGFLPPADGPQGVRRMTRGAEGAHALFQHARRTRG